MKNNFQWSAQEIIMAPLEKVWEFNMDITKIPNFHPLVSKVDYISGKTKREPGVSYRCNINEGKSRGTCVEKITEVIPYEKFTTVIPEDTWGISKMFIDYEVETLFSKIDNKTTKMAINAYYKPNGLKAKLLNIFAKKKMKSQAVDTLRGIKKMIER